MVNHNKFEIVPFDGLYLQQNPLQKESLLNFYCNIWKFDPNFAEYRRCPVCRRYFSHDEVEIRHISTCCGSPLHPHFLSNVEEAWTPNIVENELQPVLSLGRNFYGAIAVTTHNDIIGFVWGYTIDFPTLSKKWNESIIKKINTEIPCTKVTYFQEIASDPNFRGLGVGSSLCKALTFWMKNNFPLFPSMLHTHENSPAFRLFKKAGYRLFAKSDQINSGRILMTASLSSQLTPDNL